MSSHEEQAPTTGTNPSMLTLPLRPSRPTSDDDATDTQSNAARGETSHQQGNQNTSTARCHKQLEWLRGEIKTLETQVETLRNEAKPLEAQVESLRKQAKTRDAQIEMQQNEIEKLQIENEK